jgi:hypothetical protein
MEEVEETRKVYECSYCDATEVSKEPQLNRTFRIGGGIRFRSGGFGSNSSLACVPVE